MEGVGISKIKSHGGGSLDIEDKDTWMRESGPRRQGVSLGGSQDLGDASKGPPREGVRTSREKHTSTRELGPRGNREFEEGV